MFPPSYENLFNYNIMEFYMVSHMLTVGYAIMLAALFYFVLTINTVAPRYRISSVLSVVVMVSAALILFFQQQSWENAFIWDEAQQVFTRDASALPFSNGYRYLNWLIDVPMLLFQILFVVSITPERRASLRNWFFFSGAMMIITGYIGQFYEVASLNPETGAYTLASTEFYIWGFISTVFFFHVLYLMYRIIQEARKDLSPRAGAVMGAIGILFFVSWFLYPGAYLMPLWDVGAASVVGRQMTFTIADVASKVIYGILLTLVAQIRSEEEGYVYEKIGGESKAA